MTEPQTEEKQKSKRTFIAYQERDNELESFGVFKGNSPNSCAKKAINKLHKVTGATENLSTIIREAGRRTKKGEIQFRYYTGHITDQYMSPGTKDGISPWQQELAIKQDSWVKNPADGSVAMSPFPDGYDSTDDPVLKGRRPLFIAKVSHTKYLGQKILPKGTVLSGNLPLPQEKQKPTPRKTVSESTPEPTPTPEPEPEPSTPAPTPEPEPTPAPEPVPTT